MWHALVVHKEYDRQPFYSASTITCLCAFVVVNIKGERSYREGNDPVGARRIRTWRNEQKTRGPTLANKVSGKAPYGVNLLSTPGYNRFLLHRLMSSDILIS